MTSGAGANSGADSITQFDANANTADDDLIQIIGVLKTALNDDADGTLDYSVGNNADLGNRLLPEVRTRKPRYCWMQKSSCCWPISPRQV